MPTALRGNSCALELEAFQKAEREKVLLATEVHPEGRGDGQEALFSRQWEQTATGGQEISAGPMAGTSTHEQHNFCVFFGSWPGRRDAISNSSTVTGGSPRHGPMGIGNGVHPWPWVHHTYTLASPLTAWAPPPCKSIIIIREKGCKELSSFQMDPMIHL